MKNIAREIIITVLLALVIFMAIRTVAYNFEVSGNSMEPNLHNGQFVMVSKIVYWFDEPQRGDIVVYSSDNVGHHVIHRIVGLPGETIEVTKGNIFINGVQLEESYIPDGSRTIRARQVPDGNYYIIGDNRDAASWEMVREESIVGKAWICYWPVSDWGTVLNYHW